MHSDKQLKHNFMYVRMYICILRQIIFLAEIPGPYLVYVYAKGKKEFPDQILVCFNGI